MKPTSPFADLLSTSPMDVASSDLMETAPSGRLIPNENATISQPYRIAIIGEAPGRDEEVQGRPFVGMSGRLLDGLLSQCNILRAACFVGNICQHRPPDNNIKLFSFDGPQIQAGLKQLEADLATFNPNVCLLLGTTPLRAARDDASISDWRGSFFISTKPGPFINRKCIAAFHPAACLRRYDWIPLLRFDIAKAREEATYPHFTPPTRHLSTTLAAHEIIHRLNEIRRCKTTISIDIEGYWNNMSCISVATSSSDSFIIPFTNADSSSYWTNFDDELAIWQALSAVLADRYVGKILQNCLYDRFALQYGYSCVVFGTVEDTMLKHWERYCELEKGLGFLCSLYTMEPFYKDDIKAKNDRRRFFEYCCRDSAVTYEIAHAITPKLNQQQLDHYRFNLSLLDPLLYMELKGISYDTPQAQTRLAEVNSHIFTLQRELDVLAGVGFASNNVTYETILITAQAVLCYKRNPSQPKKGNEADFERVKTLLTRPLSAADLGELSILCGLSMNVKSPAYKKFLYETLSLPPQYKTDPETKKRSLCTDAEALLNIQKKQPHRAVELGIQIMELRTRAQMLEIKSDPDGRIRCGYNVVGTTTGRITCYTSPTGSGYNLQTIPDDWTIYPIGHPLRQGMRDLFKADPGYTLFQCDLKGSDGWTIGANLASLGHSVMLDDLRFGIKPAARICYMLRHGNTSLLRKERAEIKELLWEVKSDDWDYFACKVGIWGICYLMGPDLLNAQILEESQGKMSKSRSEIADFRNAVYSAYCPQIWHAAMKNRLGRHHTLTSPSGHVRKFFGRESDILGQALANEPQSVTTYATNKALQRLWLDPANRFATPRNGVQIIRPPKCDLHIQPLHQVHDALLGQFPTYLAAWASERINTYFDNQIIIAGIPITIPFEGKVGTTWGTLNNKL